MKGINKVSFLKRWFVGGVIFLLGFGFTIPNPPRAVSARRDAAPPNIIVFLVDDMGWQDTSVPFWKQKTDLNRRYHTPNMERLAREGLKLTNAYATPLCTPTRVSLMTGLNVAHHRVTNWTSPNKNTSTDYPDTVLNPVAWNINGLSPIDGVERTIHATPLPALLEQQHYYTIQVGKAHFGSAGTSGADPRKLGFRVSIAGSEIGHPASYFGEDNYDRLVKGKPNRNAVPGLDAYHGTDVFLTEALTREALKALDVPIKNKQPFFLYLGHYAVHTPIMADKRFIGKYLKAGLDSTEANYASLVEGMDKSLGDILAYLDTHKLADNTVVMFLSDNGGLSTTPPRGGKAHTHNLPLRVGKGSVYEGGIREPMLVRWPGVVKAGSVTDQYVIVEDFFPTILEIAGIRKPLVRQPIDGRTFLPLLKNPAWRDTSRALVWHHPNRWIAAEAPLVSWASGIRQGDWKLVYDQRTGALELYNLRLDIGELKNMAGEQPQKLKNLAALLTSHLKKWDAQMPTFRKTGQPVPWPEDVLSQLKP